MIPAAGAWGDFQVAFQEVVALDSQARGLAVVAREDQDEVETADRVHLAPAVSPAAFLPAMANRVLEAWVVSQALLVRQG